MSAFKTSTMRSPLMFTSPLTRLPVAEACNTAGVPHPDIVTESGRALVARSTELLERACAHWLLTRGEAVFRRKDLTCLKCHSIAGAGGLVGPDLVSIGASAQVDYLVESLLVPNKAVKEGYHAGLHLGRWYKSLDRCVSVAVTERRTREEIDGLGRSAVTGKREPNGAKVLKSVGLTEEVLRLALCSKVQR